MAGSADPGRRLRLLGRGYCHLCEDMHAALAPIAAAAGWDVEWVDVDAEPALEARYGLLVPVLLHGERELCHYHLDAESVRTYLAAVR